MTFSADCFFPVFGIYYDTAVSARERIVKSDVKNFTFHEFHDAVKSGCIHFGFLLSCRYYKTGKNKYPNKMLFLVFIVFNFSCFSRFYDRQILYRNEKNLSLRQDNKK